MEKIQLTQEQADRIDFLLNQWMTFNGDAVEEALLKVHLDNWRDENNRCLNELSLDSMARVLYTPNSYEVIPQYKAGESLFISKEATHTGKDEIRKIAGVQNGTIKFEDNWYIGIHSEYIRHATPEEIQQEKERRWWTNHGREVWEIREGDILKNETHYPYFVTRGNRTDGGLKRTPSLNCIFKEMDEIKSRFKVACFVEQRLDK